MYNTEAVRNSYVRGEHCKKKKKKTEHAHK